MWLNKFENIYLAYWLKLYCIVFYAMQKSLLHLQLAKKQDLKRVRETILSLVPSCEMIILFGSYARGDFKEKSDLKPDRKSGHVSDYDILIITEDKATALDVGLRKKITKECDSMKLSTHVRIIAHDIEELNIKLAEGQYFFTDIKKEGCFLYDSGNYKLARKRELKPKELQRIAQDHFDHWFESAESFYDAFEHKFLKYDYKRAAFQLHQATEHAYKAILLVFTNYNPNEHYLSMLGKMASKYASVLSDIFPRETDSDEELFQLFDYAYIGARYDPAYAITKEELEYLSCRVKKLHKLTEKICMEKIRSF